MWEWLGPVLGAVGGFLTVVVPLYLKVRQDAARHRAEVERAAADLAKKTQESVRKDRRDAMDEYRQALEDVRLDRVSDRELVHGLRNDCQQLTAENAVLRAQKEQAERDRDYWRALAVGKDKPKGQPGGQPGEEAQGE